MKTSLKMLCLLCFTCLMNSCHEDDPKPVVSDFAMGEVQFAFSTVAKINSHGKSAAFEEFPSGAYLSVMLLSGSDSVNQNLSLIKLGDGYISEPMTLLEAEYEITDFMIMNEDGEAIYATPKEDSPLALYVDHPLPVNFIVTQGELINLNMEVVDVIGHSPEDFGYVSFQIEIVPVPQFSLSIFIPNDGELQLTDAQGYLLHEGDTIVNESLESGVNAIDFVGSPEESYSLVVIKSGYGRYAKDFTLQELQDNSPIKVILDPAFTLITPVNETFRFNVKGSAGMTLYVDWGDGNTQTFVATGPETLSLEHYYEMVGSKFVSITGDIDLIYDASPDYSWGNTSSIHINHLTNLTHFRVVATDSPSEIDFSDNLKLKVLMVDNSSIQNIDISNNLELERLDMIGTWIPNIDIMNNPKIKDLNMTSNVLISSAELDKIIEDLLSHATSSNPPGYPRFFSYGPNMPSSTGLANLEILEDDYGWNVYYDDIVIPIATN